MNTQNYLQKFASKKDALVSIDQIIHELQYHIEYSEQIDQRILYWFKMKKEIESFDDRDLAKDVIEYFNEVSGNKYNNTEKIKAIIRQIPKVTFDQFQSVILHKAETWGRDPKMKEYMRPATLFGSKQKFITYLEDSTNYWIQKQKTNG